MTTTWPKMLPALPLRDGLAIDPVANAVGIGVEAGEPMTRVMFTGEIDDIALNVPLDTFEQAQALYNFWRYDLKNGSLPFVYEHPMLREACRFLFMTPDGNPAPPRFTSAGGVQWRAALQLKMLPA